MPALAESRWTRFGHDRVYIKTHTGDPIGFLDLKNRSVHTDVEGFDDALNECLNRWMANLSLNDLSKAESAPPLNSQQSGAPPSTAPQHDTPIPESTDLAANVAGQSAQAERNRINSEAPIRNLAARLFGVKTDERNWRVGADGERSVGRKLAKLDERWRCLHSVKVGNRGSDIDHIVIGPPGLITLNTKCHPKGSAWIGDQMVMINGHNTQYLRNSRHEAQRAHRLIAQATGWAVPVKTAIVMVKLDKFTVKQMPEDVEVTTQRDLTRWLRNLPSQLTPGQVESVFAVARLSTTWTNK